MKKQLTLIIFIFFLISVSSCFGFEIFNPWEIDPEQPKVKEVSISFRVRHYSGLTNTLPKLLSFLKSFKGCRFHTCYQYLKSR